MKVLIQGFGFLLKILILRLSARRTVFATLATMSLVLCGSAILTPWWQPVVDTMGGAHIASELDNGPSWVIAAIFFILTISFATVSHLLSKNQESEPLVQTPVVGPPVRVGNSNVSCFCGSIELMRHVDVVVTSENREITLGSICGTSVSGRARRMAATRDANGNIVVDPLHAHVEQWKAQQGNLGPFKLGTTLNVVATGALRNVATHIVLAVALEKRDDGQNAVSEIANHQIVSEVFALCAANGYSSIYIPVFGIGSGGVAPRTAIPALMAPLVSELSSRGEAFTVYIGTYKMTHSALVHSELLMSARR